ncbi:MAG TPA: PAS domain S-box protein, partial [bacterium]|nr:PAS domain S-box protein [bacterium]
MKHALVGSRQYLLIAMASTIVFGLLILLVLADQRHDMALCDQLVEGQCQQLVNECSLRLQSEITERVNDLAILAVHLSMHGDKDEREQHFVRVASTVVADQPAYHVLNYVDSDSIVRVSVPVGKRPELLGLDLKTLPGRTDLHRRVMESGEPLASPVMTLTTGDPGLVIWYPIRNGLEDRNASGMVAGTFHLNTMLARCIPVNAEDHFQILLSQDGNQFHPSPPQISAKADSFQTQETCAQFILVGCYWKVTAEPLPVSPLARLPQRIKERGAVGFVAASLFALLFGTTLTAFARARRSRAVALESEQRYRSLVDTMNEGLAIVDGSGVYTYVNQLFCEILGRERDEVIGHCPVEFAAEESKTAAEHQIVARRQGNEDRFQIAVRRKSGELRHIIVSPRLIRDSDGRFAGWLSVITDITEIKQTEQDREHLIRDLEAKNAELERFTYTVSHDLKSPLITIKGFLGLVEAEALEGRFEEMKQDIARVDSAAGKMQDLLDQLLAVHRLGQKGKD